MADGKSDTTNDKPLQLCDDLRCPWRQHHFTNCAHCYGWGWQTMIEPKGTTRSIHAAWARDHRSGKTPLEWQPCNVRKSTPNGAPDREVRR
jgi:hypothetical protein